VRSHLFEPHRSEIRWAGSFVRKPDAITRRQAVREPTHQNSTLRKPARSHADTQSGRSGAVCVADCRSDCAFTLRMVARRRRPVASGGLSLSVLALTVVATGVVAGCGRDKSTAPQTGRPTSSVSPRATRHALPRKFVVSPTRLKIGLRVTFAGTGCPADARVSAAVGGGSIAHGVSESITPRPDGSWSATAIVDDSTPLGTQHAEASCVTAASSEHIFGYKPVRVEVSTFRTLHVVSDSPVRPGTTLTLTQTGGCPSGDALAVLQTRGTNRFSVEPVGGGTASDFRPDPAGNWRGTLRVPTNIAPGTYELNVTCAGPSRSLNAWYPIVSVTVA